MKNEKINNSPQNPEDIQTQWDILIEQMDNAAFDWQKEQGYRDYNAEHQDEMYEEWRRGQGLDEVDETQEGSSEPTPEEKARAYNEEHVDEMYEEWRRGQGLDEVDETQKGSSEPTPEEKARAYNEEHVDEMYEEWRRGQGLDEVDEDQGNTVGNTGGNTNAENDTIIDLDRNKNPEDIRDRLKDVDERLAENQQEILREIDDRLKENEKELLKAIDGRIEEIDKEIEKILELHPLTAINADASFDRKNLARDKAEIAFNEKKANSGFFKRIGMNFLEKYYKMKYEKEILNGDRKITVDGKEVTLDEALQDRSKGAIGRMVRSVAENEMGYVHEKFNESRDQEADKDLTEVVRSAIAEYAEARGDAADEKLFKAKLREQMERLKMDSGNSDLVNNYFEVAENAIALKDLARGTIGFEKILDGVEVYNATIRDGARSEVHRSKIDNILEKYESTKLGSFIKPEVLAVAAGVASVIAKSGSSRAASMIIPGGGIAFAGAMAGVREHNRVTNDRERMMRDIEGGLEYSSEDDIESASTRRERKAAKYEAKIGNTTYKVEQATDLTKNLEKAMESGDNNQILEALAAAKVRIDMSDSDRKGLIAFSSENNRGDERLALDIAVIQARRSLSEEDRNKLAEIEKRTQAEIQDDIDTQDKRFNRTRAGLVAKQVAKTVAIGATTFLASQEIMAALSPDKVGVLEKLGVLKTDNRVGADETILASAVPRAQEDIQLTSDQQAEIERLELAGYKRVQVAEGATETRTVHTEINPSDSSHRANVMVREWANNGTIPYDGNELNVSEVSPGTYVTNMVGNSTTPSGKVLNFEELANSGRLKGFLTLNGTRFEVQGIPDGNGQFTFCNNGVFTTPKGDIIHAVGANGERFYDFFEVGASMGTDPSTGMEEFIPMATAVGNGGQFNGVFEEAITEVIQNPDVFNMVPPETAVTFAGIPIPPMSARVGLGGPEQVRTEPEQGSTEAGQGNTEPVAQTPPVATATPPVENDTPPVAVATPPDSRDSGGNAEPTTSEPAPDASSSANQGTSGPNTDNGTGEQEPVDRERTYLGVIRSLSESFNEDILSIMTETIDRTPEEYAAFWQGLSELQKHYIARIQGIADDTVSPGRGFRNWLESLQNQAA